MMVKIEKINLQRVKFIKGRSCTAFLMKSFSVSSC